MEPARTAGAGRGDAAQIVSWVTENSYPIHQELVFYLLGVGGIPLLAYLLGRAFSRRQPPMADPLSGRDSEGEERPGRTGRGIWTAVFCAAAYLLAFNPRIDGMVDMFHEGERLAPLEAASHGGKPYRDIYFQHGLSRNYLVPQLGVWIFGPTVEGVRRLHSVLDPLSYVALFLLGAQIYRGRAFSALLVVFITAGTNFWIVPRQGLGLLSTFFLVRWIMAGESRSPRNHLLTASGFVTGFLLWHSLEFGLYTIAASGLYLSAGALFGGRSDGRRRALLPPLWYGGGAALSAGGIALTLGVCGVLPDALRNIYYQAAYQLVAWGLPFPPPAALWQQLREGGAAAFLTGEAFLMYLTPAVLAAVGAMLALRAAAGRLWAERRSGVLLLLFFQGAFSFRTALGRSDFGHWIDGSTYLWIFGVYLIDAAAAGVLRLRRSDESRFRVQAALAAGLAVAALCAGWLALQVHRPHTALLSRVERIASPRPRPLKAAAPRLGRLAIPDFQAEQLRDVVSAIERHTGPGDYIYDFSNQGAYYFFARRPPGSRFFHPVYAATPALQQQTIQELEERGVRLVIFKTGSAFDAIDGIPGEKRHPLIADYLRRRFAAVENIRGTELWLRRVDPE